MILMKEQTDSSNRIQITEIVSYKQSQMILDKRANGVSLTNGTETGHRKKKEEK